MAERRDGPRILHDPDRPSGDANASVDVGDLLAKLSEQTAELAEARVKQEQAEAKLKKKAGELESEQAAHDEVVQRLEADCRELEAECQEVAAACGELEAVLAGQRTAHAATEADLKGAKERGAALHHQLRVVQAQQGQDKPQGPPPWWRRFGP
jgi:septal ring factor EnvC (AmiA/AmiB activator)